MGKPRPSPASPPLMFAGLNGARERCAAFVTRAITETATSTAISSRKKYPAHRVDRLTPQGVEQQSDCNRRHDNREWGGHARDRGNEREAEEETHRGRDIGHRR